ncbi:hypothetical protein AAFF_G00018500 [Aldrovandia affinis]|uniref:Uncharacterized protein n=1 Tax=Aldrovandia affinis TaxID=143900 RepID=A0AAD7S5M7_9TELE|nr:hypothetical protein AAFF_G00018500 [Aldrovandia affinis]
MSAPTGQGPHTSKPAPVPALPIVGARVSSATECIGAREREEVESRRGRSADGSTVTVTRGAVWETCWGVVVGGGVRGSKRLTKSPTTPRGYIRCITILNRPGHCQSPHCWQVRALPVHALKQSDQCPGCTIGREGGGFWESGDKALGGKLRTARCPEGLNLDGTWPGGGGSPTALLGRWERRERTPEISQ